MEAGGNFLTGFRDVLNIYEILSDTTPNISHILRLKKQGFYRFLNYKILLIYMYWLWGMTRKWQPNLDDNLHHIPYDKFLEYQYVWFWTRMREGGWRHLGDCLIYDPILLCLSPSLIEMFEETVYEM